MTCGQVNPPIAASRSAADLDALARGLAASLSSSALVQRDVPLAPRTTLRVGGPADIYVEPASESDLAAVRRFCTQESLRFFLLGRGSNLLVRDGGVRGVVVRLEHPCFRRITTASPRLRCGAGARLKDVANEARRQGLAGLEFMDGIPGSVGGALRMNAGAMGSWTFNVLESVRYLDPAGDIRERPASEIPVRYRGCAFFADHVALAAVFAGHPDSEAAIRARMDSCNRKRWESQPPQPSAGCIFQNAAAAPAGRLIDQLGLKGVSVGGAAVSEVHANFIVNTGHASARDVLGLIDLIRGKVKSAAGIDLVTEVEIVGED